MSEFGGLRKYDKTQHSLVGLGNNSNNNNNNYIDGRIYLNFTKSVQSSAWLTALKPAANGTAALASAVALPKVLR